jgi:hypothetical protein
MQDAAYDVRSSYSHQIGKFDAMIPQRRLVAPDGKDGIFERMDPVFARLSPRLSNKIKFPHSLTPRTITPDAPRRNGRATRAFPGRCRVAQEQFISTVSPPDRR